MSQGCPEEKYMKTVSLLLKYPNICFENSTESGYGSIMSKVHILHIFPGIRST